VNVGCASFEARWWYGERLRDAFKGIAREPDRAGKDADWKNHHGWLTIRSSKGTER
jgi:hypothetical protein